MAGEAVYYWLNKKKMVSFSYSCLTCRCGGGFFCSVVLLHIN